ncbi:MAG: PIN domain nuclease [Kangiella sp.]|nr:MAG: PIN domain nuclease [Kangiella sp.]
MKVLFDINVILDVLLQREEFLELSSSLVSAVETGVIKGYLCATTLTTIDYLVSKQTNKVKARTAIQSLLKIFQIASVNRKVIAESASSQFTDFEDAVQYFSGLLVPVDSIVSRNVSDFKQADCPVYSPSELWSIVKIT